MCGKNNHYKFEFYGFSESVVPHSGQTPLTFPIIEYPQATHSPRSRRWSLRRNRKSRIATRALNVAISATITASNGLTCESPGYLGTKPQYRQSSNIEARNPRIAKNTANTANAIMVTGVRNGLMLA